MFCLRCYFCHLKLVFWLHENKTLFTTVYSAKGQIFAKKTKHESRGAIGTGRSWIKYINQLENQNVNLTIHSLEKVISALELTPEEFFNFDSLEASSDPTDSLSLKRVNMKIKQLPVGKREKILTIFEDLLDSL